MHRSALSPRYAGLLRTVPSLHLGAALGPPTFTASTPPPAPARPARLDVGACAPPRRQVSPPCSTPILDADPAAASLFPRCRCVSSATAPTDDASRCCASPLLPPVLCVSPHPSLARPEPSRPTTPLLHPSISTRSVSTFPSAASSLSPHPHTLPTYLFTLRCCPCTFIRHSLSTQ
jgi:hypothetical protein